MAPRKPEKPSYTGLGSGRGRVAANPLAPPVTESSLPVWGEGERPSWLAPEEQQPKKKDWSPARDRMEAEMELRARLEEQRHLRRKSRLKWVTLPFVWTVSLAQAVVSVSRNEPDAPEPEAPAAPVSSGQQLLNQLPAVHPAAPPGTEQLPAGEGARTPPSQGADQPGQAQIETSVREPSTAPVKEPEEEVDWTQAPPDRPWTKVEELPPAPGGIKRPEHRRPPAGSPESDSADWPEWVPPAAATRPPSRQSAPHKDWRPGAPTGPEPESPEVAAEPVAEAGWQGDPAPPAPEAAREPAPAPAPAAAVQPVVEPPAPPPLAPTELGSVILETMVRTCGAEAGVLVLLQDDKLVVRASQGLEPDVAARMALDALGDICLDVIASARSFRASDSHLGEPDPLRPGAVLCVPITLSGASVGCALLVDYSVGASFTDNHETLVRTLADAAGPELAGGGAYGLGVEEPGVRYRTLEDLTTPPPPAAAAPAMEPETPAAETKPAEAAPEQTPAPPSIEDIHVSPKTTLALDRESVRRLVEEARAAREAAAIEAARLVEEQQLATEATQEEAREAAFREAAERELIERLAAERAAAEQAGEPLAAEERLPYQPEPVAGEGVPTDQVPAVEAQPEPEPEYQRAPIEPRPERPEPRPHGPSWRARVQSRMTRVRQQQDEENARYRNEILNAIRNLTWEGYLALIADIYRRKAFEVLPPPEAGSDLDVIDLVVDRDEQRMLVNCQLRGAVDIPSAAVTEMGNVVYNYSVAGAYLVTDGSFDAASLEVAPQHGIVLVDGNALIDLTIETTLKDESKPTLGKRLAGRFSRKK